MISPPFFSLLPFSPVTGLDLAPDIMTRWNTHHECHSDNARCYFNMNVALTRECCYNT